MIHKGNRIAYQLRIPQQFEAFRFRRGDIFIGLLRSDVNVGPATAHTVNNFEPRGEKHLTPLVESFLQQNVLDFSLVVNEIGHSIINHRKC